MNKTELIAEVAKKCGMSKKDAEKAVTTTFDTITEALSQGDKVQLVGFGGFETKKREARMGRNPKTKEAIEIPATTIPVFKAGKALKEGLQNNAARQGSRSAALFFRVFCIFSRFPVDFSGPSGYNKSVCEAQTILAAGGTCGHKSRRRCNIMAKLSAKYEVLYIIDPAQGEEGIAALVEKFKGIVEAHGTLTSVDEWGKRRLAYPINDLVEGYYVYMTCEVTPEMPAELDRVFKITDGILRSIIVAVEE